MTLKTRVVDVGITVGVADKERKMAKQEAKKAEQQRYAHFGMSNGARYSVSMIDEWMERMLEVLEEDAALVIISTDERYLRLNVDHIVTLVIDTTVPDTCIVAEEVY